MKYLFSLLIFGFSFVSLAQDETPCPQIPTVKPEVPASYDGDMVKYFSSDMSEDLKKSTVSGTFRMYVDCKGEVLKVKFESGSMSDADQKTMLVLIKDMNWTPASDDGRTVTSNVYIVMDFTNGQLELKIY